MILQPVPNTPDEMVSLLVYLLPGNRPKSLRALSFRLTPYTDTEAGTVVLRSHFFKTPTEDGLELIKDLEAELYSQTSDKFVYDLEVQTSPIGTQMDLLPHVGWIDGAEAYRNR